MSIGTAPRITDIGRPPGAVKRAFISAPDAPPGLWTVERAYVYCEELARAHSEALPLVMNLVRAEMRPHLLALYAFVRTADDFADEPEYEGHRVEALDGHLRVVSPPGAGTVVIAELPCG